MKATVAAILASLIVVSAFIAIPAHAAGPVPCETMLKDMRASKAAAKLGAADMARVNDLEAKAVERCNADDDTRSDMFLSDAMKIMGKAGSSL